MGLIKDNKTKLICSNTASLAYIKESFNKSNFILSTEVDEFLMCFFYSSSKLGGVVSMICFFFNHEECTRVMWTPPLRESFGYPMSLLQILLVSLALKSPQIHQKRLTAAISVATALYLMTWQFAQFTLFTQVAAIYGLYVLELVPERETVKTVLRGIFVSASRLSSSLLKKFYNSKG